MTNWTGSTSRKKRKTNLLDQPSLFKILDSEVRIQDPRRVDDTRETEKKTKKSVVGKKKSEKDKNGAWLPKMDRIGTAHRRRRSRRKTEEDDEEEELLIEDGWTTAAGLEGGEKGNKQKKKRKKKKESEMKQIMIRKDLSKNKMRSIEKTNGKRYTAHYLFVSNLPMKDDIKSVVFMNFGQVSSCIDLCAWVVILARNHLLDCRRIVFN
ncbi:hypothetical protein GCK72_005251 [Caenorhabditis remanei]|uniref:Uncharacterized protein n=1 Tax=Caenorhabditis remanei TaxID=31234 RepID=A0A6A5HE15_CAERE|nr:hypothetical protein GCK72_005251 [Caenorhabditis remanei]KAF1765299.1 hypothetical protein GCK72_005251 [Caenorhabditis remanei]